MFKIKTNYTENRSVGEVNLDPSETRPDMAIPLKTLLDRHRRGIAVPLRNPEYSDEDFPDFKNMDLAELQEYRENLAQDMLDWQEQEKSVSKRIAEEHKKIQEYNLQKRIEQELKEKDA